METSRSIALYTMSLSLGDKILALVPFISNEHGERRIGIRGLAKDAEALEAFVKNCRDNYDHEEDAHKYGTLCRCCEAEKLLPRPPGHWAETAKDQKPASDENDNSEAG